jgi:hypothetical protein
MQPKSLPSVSSDDGFRKSDSGLTWEDTDSQNLFFLHGALHIFYARAEFRKLTWKPGIPLIERIQGKLKEGWFPLLVAEGTSNQKLTKIRHNTYLSRGYRSFATLDGALFLYGLSLAESDEHVLTLISGDQSNLTHLFISIFGDPKSDENKRIRDRVKGVADDRSTHSKEKLRIYFFDAITARVWGDQKTKKEERGPKTSHALNL